MRYARNESIIGWLNGLMMHAVSPWYSASSRNLLLIMSRRGRPNEMFDTPRTNLRPFEPYSSCNNLIARTVSSAAFCSELTVRVSVSMKISRGCIPYFWASAIMRFATATRPSADGAIPSSSIQSATTAPPYFFINGNIYKI